MVHTLARKAIFASLAILPPMLAAMPAAKAACVPPEGRYIGSGGGPASMTPRAPGQPFAPLVQGVMTTTFFLDFSDSSAWKYRYLSEFAGPAPSSVGPITPSRTPLNNPILRFFEGSTGSVSIDRSDLDVQLPAAPPTGWQRFDRVTCTALLRIEGDRYTSSSGMNLVTPLGAPEKGYFDHYNMTVSQNGDVITLKRTTNMNQPNTGFSVRLERQ